MRCWLVSKDLGTSFCSVSLFCPKPGFYDLLPQSAESLFLMLIVRYLVSMFFSSASEQRLRTVPGRHLKPGKVCPL